MNRFPRRAVGDALAVSDACTAAHVRRGALAGTGTGIDGLCDCGGRQTVGRAGAFYEALKVASKSYTVFERLVANGA